MTITELFDSIKTRFLSLPGVEELLKEPIRCMADREPERTLLPEGDIPSEARRPEYRVTALFRNAKGEAYTETPADFEGTLKDALCLPVSEKGIDARIIASINAVMAHLGLCPGTFPDDPEVHCRYADALCSYVSEHYGKTKLILVGYDGYVVKKFMEEGMDFWTMDRDPDNITKDRFHHVIVNSGKYNREACFAWGDLFMITGSTLCNGTIIQYLDHGKELLFYGITGGGVCRLLDLPWFFPDNLS